MKRIPIGAAAEIARKYDYDQVIIIARKEGGPGEGGEHCTTYGRNAKHCEVAADIGDFLKYKVMKWQKETPDVTIGESGRDKQGDEA